MDDDGALTAQERGDTHPAFRGVARVVIVVTVALLVVGVVLAGNFVHTGTLLPWLRAGDSAAPVVTAPPTADATDGPAVPKTPAQLVADEDARLAAVAALAPDDPALVEQWNTVVLAPRSGQLTGYGVADLIAAGAVRADDDRTLTLIRNVVVRRGAELDFFGGGTVRMLSSAQGTTSIVVWGGILGVFGDEDDPLVFTSWDEAAVAPDLDESDGRAYVRARDGVLGIGHAEFRDLGYWSGRTGGLAVTGTGDDRASAGIVSTKITGLHYGVFFSDTTEAGIQDSTIENSTMTGIEATNGASDTTIERTTVSGSGGDGISISRQSTGTKITDSTVDGSAGWGVRVDGAALADGPTSGGYGLSPAEGFALTGSRVTGNREGGVRVISTDTTEIRSTRVEETRTAVLVQGPSTGLTVTDADLTSSDLRALDVSGEITDATVSDSRLAGRRIALELTGAAVIVRDNDLRVASGFAVELSEGARADITGNTFHGVGQDVVASWSGSRTMQADNVQTDWTFQWAWVGWMNEHPMMWMWSLVLLIPAIGVPVLWRRRREHRKLRALLHEALLRHGEEQVAAYRADAPPASWQPPDPFEREAVPVAARDAARTAGRSPGSAPGPAPSRAPAARPASASTSGGRPAHHRPRSFADLRTGPLEGRTFASLQQFAVAAVLEGGYPVPTIARLFRIQQWRLQQWVEEAARNSNVGGGRR
ncbi:MULTISPECIES: right-handed parallel beta-helix repeat-containing protein [Microbacterium]|uniref:right-handed parallel beta-helix repeat-containing protein n=1 Tax=Microbacterium TaxID=33882 RepID=UPI001D176E29|nr:right-handed parallel beta-helix repeat-containing protein [Microbacterium testaceum]MCC4248550.1 right-handed parallel beta-helix repeat-containing protein [Microbacterium testaceum]